MKVTPEIIAKLLAEHPGLTVDGWQYTTLLGSEGFEPVRWLLLTREFEDDVQLAIDHIKAAGVLDVSSARVKHAIEKAHACHVSLGAVIAAALLLGYLPVRDPRSPICTFQTKERHHV